MEVCYSKSFLIKSMIDSSFNYYYYRKSRARGNGLIWSRVDTTQLYEDPDKLGSRGQGNYELTQCPAYESTTTKPQPVMEVDQDSDYVYE